MKTTKPILDLVVEAEGNTLWGRIHYKDALIVDEADDVLELQKKMASHLLEDYKLNTSDYELKILYDISAVFKQHTTLNATLIAERAGINRSLMAQYAAGIKYPSLSRTAKIQQVIHEIGNELRSINLAVKMEPVASFEVYEEPDWNLSAEEVNVFVPEITMPGKRHLKIHWPGKAPKLMTCTQANLVKFFVDLSKHTHEISEDKTATDTEISKK